MNPMPSPALLVRVSAVAMVPFLAGPLRNPTDEKVGREVDSVRSLHLVDLNGDGRADKLVSDQAGTLRVEINRAGRVFEPVHQELPLAFPEHVLATDLDGDGWVDLFLLERGGCMALLGDGTGQLREATEVLGFDRGTTGESSERVDLDRLEPDELVIRTLRGELVFWPEAGGFRLDPDSTVSSVAVARPLSAGIAASAKERQGETGPGQDGPVTSRAALPPSATGSAPFLTNPVGDAPCNDSIADQAGGTCLLASSTPVPGTLLPLGEFLFVDPLGRMGLGTTAPATNLEIVGSGEHALGRIRTMGGIGSVAGWQVQQGGVGYTIGTGASDFGGWGSLGFRSFAGVTAAVMTVDGNVGIGTTSPNYRLEVRGKARFNEEVKVQGSDASTSVTPGQVDVRSSTGVVGVSLRGKGSSNDVRLFNSNGDQTIQLNGLNGQAKTKTLVITGGSDLVELFQSCEELLPGAVVVADENHPGQVVRSKDVHDTRVVGVVSGAGGVNPGLQLSQEGALEGDVRVALAGRVFVRCSTENGPIRVGDRLTSASIEGHAMRVGSGQAADGAVLGKALSTLEEPTGLVLVLVNLQ